MGNLSAVKIFMRKIINKLPNRLQNIVFRIALDIRFFMFIVKMRGNSHNGLPQPERVYWISPKRIIYHTNYLEKKSSETIPLSNRVFDTTMRGKVVEGNWDITNYKFTDLLVYKAINKRIREGVKWQDTTFYKTVRRQVEFGQTYWGCKNKDDLDKRVKYIDSLYQSIKNKGYHLNRNISDKNFDFTEIDVNVGRNGGYLFQNGRHRLAIAKILGINYVPVMVFVRHKKWQEFRRYVISYAQQNGGKLYQPIVHPDLADIPTHHNCQERLEAIQRNLGKKRCVMLDIGSNLGFFCHKFEDLGYQCYAIEQDPATFRILEKIRIAENKKFKAIKKSMFEIGFIKKMKFDVVLALNIFHHFLKTKRFFFKLKDFLKNLETTEMFFEPHLYLEDQMKDAYVNYSESEFVNFILQNTSLNEFKLIHTARDGRHIFKLYKT